MSDSLPDRARALIEGPNFCFVGTTRTDGSAHVVPVWVDVEDDKLVLNTVKGRAWPTHAARDARIALTIPNRENPYEYVEIRGRVAEITGQGAEAHVDRLAKKYLDADVFPGRGPEEERIIVRVAPEHVRYQPAS
jgi:PPOX class probable F420-dependent enzyme